MCRPGPILISLLKAERLSNVKLLEVLECLEETLERQPHILINTWSVMFPSIK